MSGGDIARRKLKLKEKFESLKNVNVYRLFFDRSKSMWLNQEKKVDLCVKVSKSYHWGEQKQRYLFRLSPYEINILISSPPNPRFIFDWAKNMELLVTDWDAYLFLGLMNYEMGYLLNCRERQVRSFLSRCKSATGWCNIMISNRMRWYLPKSTDEINLMYPHSGIETVRLI